MHSIAKNDSRAANACLIWDYFGAANDEPSKPHHGAAVGTAPGTNPTWHCDRRRFPHLERTFNIFATVGEPIDFSRAGGDIHELLGERHSRHGLKRPLETVREIENNPNLLRDANDAQPPPSARKRCDDLYEWQRCDFEALRQSDARSLLQIQFDAKREKDRTTKAEFLNHLHRVARRRPANRVPLRPVPQRLVLDGRDRMPAVACCSHCHAAAEPTAQRVNVGQHPPDQALPKKKNLQAAVAAVRPMTARAPHPPKTCDSSAGSNRPMSSRVKSKIQELADHFLLKPEPTTTTR